MFALQRMTLQRHRRLDLRRDGDDFLGQEFFHPVQLDAVLFHRISIPHGRLASRKRAYGATAWALGSLSVDFSPVSDGHDQHNQTVVVDFVNDAIRADADAPGGTSGKLFASRRAGMVRERANGRDDPVLIRTPDFRQLFLSGSKDLQHVGQDSRSDLISRTACSNGIVS